MGLKGAAIVELECFNNCDGWLSVTWHHTATALLGIVQHQYLTWNILEDVTLASLSSTALAWPANSVTAAAFSPSAFLAPSAFFFLSNLALEEHNCVLCASFSCKNPKWCLQWMPPLCSSLVNWLCIMLLVQLLAPKGLKNHSLIQLVH